MFYTTKPIGGPTQRLPTEDDTSISWEDWGRAVGAGAHDVIGSIAGAVETATGGEVGGKFRRARARRAEDIRSGISPVGRQAASAAFLPEEGEQSIFDVGLGSALGMKSMAAVPSVVTAVVPGGLIGMAARRAGLTLLQAGAVGSGTARVTEGAMVAGEVSNEIRRTVESFSDNELAARIPQFKAYLNMGMTPAAARKKYMNDVVGIAPVAAFMATAAFGGVEGMVAGRLAGRTAAGGIVRGAGKGAGQEAAQEAIQGVTGTTLEQQALAAEGLTEENWRAVVNAGLEGGVVGAIIGAPGGAISGIGGKSGVGSGQRPTTTTTNVVATTSTPPVTPVKPNTSSMPTRAAEAITKVSPNATAPGPVTPPPATTNPQVAAAVGNPQNAPTGSNIKYPKARPRPAPTNAAPVVTPDPSVTPEIAAAIAATSGTQVTPRVTPAPESMQEQLDKIQKGAYWTPPASPASPQVTPEATPSAPAPRTPARIQREERVPYAEAVRIAEAEGWVAPASPTVPPVTSGVTPNAPQPQPVASPAEIAPASAPADISRPAVTPVGFAPPDISQASQRIAKAQAPVSVQPAVAPLPTPQAPAAAPAAQRVAPALQSQTPVTPAATSDSVEYERARRAAEPGVMRNPELQSAAGVIAPRGPRILQDRGERAQLALQQTEEFNKQRAEEVARRKRSEERISGKNLTKAEIAKQQADSAKSLELFNKFAPEDAKVPRTPEEREVLKKRVDAIVEEAEAVGIKIPLRVHDTTPDGLVYLREAKDLSTRMGNKAFVGPQASEHMTSFLMREAAAKAGDFELMRQERKEEGELKSKVKQGDVENIAAPFDAVLGAATEEEAAQAEQAQFEVEEGKLEGKPDESIVGKGDVETKISGGKRTIKTYDEEKAKEVAEKSGRKVEITEEMRRRYETPGAKKEEVASKVVTSKVTKPKITPKVAEVKAKAEAQAAKTKSAAARVKEAIKKVDKKATPAQEAVGNYKTGPLNLFGLKMKIQYVKGEERNGKASPAHYGHILGTESADGEQIDFFMGPYPDSDFVMVIDQKNLETNEFNEHKVMLGFKNVLAAQEVYEDSFADKKGFDRVQDMRVMTVEEFKTWIKGNTKRPTGATPEAAVVEDVTSDAPLEEQSQETLNVSTQARLLKSSRTAIMQADIDYLRFTEKTALEFIKKHNIHSASLGDMLKSSQKSMSKKSFSRTLSKLQQTLYPSFAKKIIDAAGDVQVYIMPDLEFSLVSDEESDGYYSPLSDIIVIPLKTTEGNSFERVLLHEGVHAGLIKATHENPALRDQLDRIFQEALFAAASDPDPAISKFYGLSDIDEMIAEAISNPKFQAWLASVAASPELKKALKLDSSVHNLWDTFIRTIARALNMPGAHGSLLHAVFKTSAQIELGASRYEGPASDQFIRNALDYRKISLQAPLRVNSRLLPENVRERLPERIRNSRLIGSERQTQIGAPRALRFRTMDQIAQVAKDFFGKNNPVRTIADLVEQIRVSAEERFNRHQPIVAKLYKLERKYKNTVLGMSNGKPVTQWDEFAALVHDETMAGVYADRDLASQKHLGKDALKGYWPKKQHADLAARYQALPQDLKDARREAMSFYTNQQNEMSLSIINNRILKAFGYSDPDLGQRLFDKKATEEDKALLGQAYDLIMEAEELAKIEGPYFPLMRRGEWVVQALLKIISPGNLPAGVSATQLDENTWEFSAAPGTSKKQARKQAIKFAEAQSARPTLRTIWVHRSNGEPWVVDDDGKVVRITKNDMDAEQRFRVSVQHKHVEFFETEREASEAAHSYASTPEGQREFTSVDGVQRRRYEPHDRQSAMLSSQLERLMKGVENRSTYRDMTAQQQNEVVQALREASIRFQAATRVQSRRLPRTYVAGASRDLTRNTLNYAQSTSSYLARLEHQPALDEALKEMNRQVSEVNENYGKQGSVGRSVIAHEINKRVHEVTAFEDPGRLGAVTQRAASFAFLKFLFSPAYSVINSLQPAMLTYPTLAARYGAGRAASFMYKAYDDIGGLSVAGSGLRATLAKVRSPSDEQTSFIDEVKSRLTNNNERRMIEYLHQRGSLGLDVGLEIARMIENKGGVLGQIDTGLGYLSGIGRQMPRAVETINRTVSALSAYRLEMARSGDHDAAVLYAQEATNLTQGIYSHTDTPPIFNHPLGRLALQFKKYGQLAYGLMGHHIGKAIRNTNPGDRAEALKALGYIAAAHIIVAGSLGLPTEPIKWLIFGLNQVGITELTWDDVEHYQRQLATEFFGKTIGEALTRGVTRIIPGVGFDLSSRAGWQDLLTYGSPRSDEKQDLMAYFGETLGGAPTAMIIDSITGIHDLVNGDVVKGIEKLSPIKVGSNIIRAIRQTTEGKKTAAGYESLEPYSLTEAFIRSFGFTPSKEAETTEQRRYFEGVRDRQDAQRTEIMHDWREANPGARARMWGSIERWNKGREREERLTRADLDAYVKRRKTEEKSGTVKGGFRVAKRDVGLYRRTEEIYNLR